jgi:hypothetical protein
MDPLPAAALARRRRIGGACLVLAPLVMLVADTIGVLGGDGAFWVWSVGMWISLLLFLAAILEVVHQLAHRADRFGLAFGALAIVGLFTAATMQGVFRVQYVLEEQAAGMGDIPIIMATSIAPGILFPLSLLVLAIGLGRSRVLGWGAAIALALGAILFPVGRFIIGDLRISVASDALMLVGLLPLALRAWRASSPEAGYSGRGDLSERAEELLDGMGRNG